MRICSVTVTSRTRENLIADALKSVSKYVSEILIIHLIDADGNDNTLGVARQIGGKRVKIVNASIKDGMPALRNKGLFEAKMLGCDWALILDTDERIIPNGVDMREVLELAGPDVHAIDVTRVGGSEQRTKFIRLPASGSYSGLMHEEYVPVGGRVEQIVGLRFSEVGKGSPDREPSFCIPHIERQIEEDPTNSRWRYYRALMLEYSGKLYDAIEAYEVVNNPILDGWISFRIACCHAKLKDYGAALEECCNGMKHSPTHAELPWFASLQAMQLGEPEKALSWAKMAHSLGWSGIPERFITCRGPRNIKAFYEGPLEVMQMAYMALDLYDQASQAERAAMSAQFARVSIWGDTE